jgi:hypothetical protein
VIFSPLVCFRVGYSNLAIVANDFVRICSSTKLFVCGTLLVGKDVQPLQSVKPIEDHVWFEDWWMVTSWCDEWLTTLCGLTLG